MVINVSSDTLATAVVGQCIIRLYLYPLTADNTTEWYLNYSFALNAA